jgi:hypothetical protein
MIRVNSFLLQIILAARRYDEDSGWMQLLVFVIMAVFWALGSIIKARKSKKTEFEEEEEQPEEAFSERMQQMSRQMGPQQKKSVYPGPAIKRDFAKAEKIPLSVSLKDYKESVTKSLTETEKKAERPDISSERPQPPAGIDFAPNLEDPENLKRAVVYYEVLGKPLSLRDEPDNIIRH